MGETQALAETESQRSIVSSLLLRHPLSHLVLISNKSSKPKGTSVSLLLGV